PDDAPLRPAIDRPAPPADAQHPELAAAITRLAHLRRDSTALRRGDYRTMHIASEQLAFARTSGDETMIAAAHASRARAAMPLSAGPWSGQRFVDRLDPSEPLVITNDHILLNVPPCWGRVVTVE